MKTNRVMLLMLALLIATLIQNAQAFYNPSTGRWLSRDPLGEPGFEALRQQSRSQLAGGFNRYLFVGNSGLNHIDRLGLDVWVIKECSGISHRWAVGNNSDGTYWSTDFMPNATSLIGRLCCMGTINFNASELTLNPTNLPSGFCIERHVTASQAATDDAKQMARDYSECPTCKTTPYMPVAYDCRDWVKSIADKAEKHQKDCERCKPESGEKPKAVEK